MTHAATTRARTAVWLLAASLALPLADAAAQNAKIAVAPDGSIFLGDGSFIDGPAVIRVDPVSGSASILSSNTVGSGPIPFYPWDIAVDTNGSLLVTENGLLGGAAPRVVRIDPVSGDRTTISDANTGTGPILQSPRSVTVAPDGTAFITDFGGGYRILHMDSLSGDRTTISDDSMGTGSRLLADSIAVEPDGNLVTVGLGTTTVMRIDPATGDRTTVSGEGTGTGPPVVARAIDVEPDGMLLVPTYGAIPRFCVPLSGRYLLCIVSAASIVRVDPVNGDRTRVSGGGSCLAPVKITVPVSKPSPIVEWHCVTRYFGTRGRGPDFVSLTDIAVESAQSFVVADAHRVLRVNARNGQRTLLSDITLLTPPSPLTTSSIPDRIADSIRTSAEQNDQRLYTPRYPRAWLRRALGDGYKSFAGRPLEDLFSRLSETQRRAVGERLYMAVWETMRRVLGADDPDIQEAAREISELSASGRKALDP